jgi:peptidoglycan hydrolase CwlO-like protein
MRDMYCNFAQKLIDVERKIEKSQADLTSKEKEMQGCKDELHAIDAKISQQERSLADQVTESNLKL